MNEKKDIRIIGAGPAGLVAAIDLNRQGYNVILQDKQKAVGGEPGWHPSVHSTPVAVPALWEYIGIDCSEAFVDADDKLMFYLNGQGSSMPSPYENHKLYNTERGPRDTSLDSFLFRIAEKEGVNIEFKKRIGEEEFKKLPKGSILATGLSPGAYTWLGLESSVFSGYWAYTEIEKDFVSSAGYLGHYSNEYGYSSAANGIWYVLLFARNEVSKENLQAFKTELEELEGRTFDEWRRFSGRTPKGPQLYHKDMILTGTVAGFIEPAYGFGITGALLSGKIAAMAVYNPEKAEAEFKKYTDGIITHIQRKRQEGYVPEAVMGGVWFDIS